ncbi:MAG: hypothetical protein AAGL49_00415 [Pseudomonadota bacterium]
MLHVLKTTSAVASLAFILGSGSPAHAEPVTAKFAYAHDLSAEENYSRFEAIAQRACRMDSVFKLPAMKIERRCRAEMIDQVIEALDKPELAAVHAMISDGAKKNRRGVFAWISGGDR